MDIVSIILIGIGLAMDCFAVSTTQGLKETRWTAKAVWMALLFGVFQGGMPMIGYLCGTIFTDFFRSYSPWIALGLLAYIGGKMIWESIHEKEEKDEKKELEKREEEKQERVAFVEERADWSNRYLITLAVATSIDALATGVIFIPCPYIIELAIVIIALCSFVFSLSGYLIGVYVGQKFRLNVELIGGLILIGIGLKIFIEGRGWELLM